MLTNTKGQRHIIGHIVVEWDRVRDTIKNYVINNTTDSIKAYVSCKVYYFQYSLLTVKGREKRVEDTNDRKIYFYKTPLGRISLS